MLYLVPIIITSICIVIISKGYSFLGGCIIYGAIVFLLRFALMFIEDLEWMSESLVNEEKIKSIRKDTAAYDFVLARISEGKIKKGMSLEELNKVLNTLEGQFQIFNCCGMAQSEKGSKNYFYGYGKGIPSPRVILTVKKGKLASLKHHIGLSNWR